jgi:hypothetical protein
MPTYLIRWNAGFGEMIDEVEADNEEEAEKVACEAWREDAENNAEYSADLMTEELADDYGFDWNPE